jgi:hypothetical protein
MAEAKATLLIIGMTRVIPRRPFFFLSLLCLVAIGVSGATTNGQTVRPNTWGARTSSGLTLMGTWTVVPDTATGTVIGTWTLLDAEGRMVTSGGWSASKSPEGWSGNWRAVIDGNESKYSGEWSASVELKADARFADLFEKAVQSAVSGKWRAGRQSGAWAIQGYK